MSYDALIGKTIGTYQVVSFLDSGGFGAVYKGQHLFLKNRVVAIKVLRNILLDSSEKRDSFLREAQILEQLEHKHILPIVDVGIQDDLPFLLTKYAQNGSLRKRLASQPQKPLPLSDALTILTQVGQALSYAHEQHIIHRDLKPENILFDANGEALLADFGIATVIETASVVYTTATGTPAYMAPEQFRGSVSRSSDQYAFGCIAYELFTGSRPFTAPDFVSMGFKHASELPIPPTQLNSYLAPHIEQAVLKAMAKERKDRFPDVAAFLAALQPPSPYTTIESSPQSSLAPEPVPSPELAEVIPGRAKRSAGLIYLLPLFIELVFGLALVQFLSLPSLSLPIIVAGITLLTSLVFHLATGRGKPTKQQRFTRYHDRQAILLSWLLNTLGIALIVIFEILTTQIQYRSDLYSN